MSVRKYTGWNRNERTITGGATNQFIGLIFEADDDCTAVGVHVELSLCPEAPTTPDAHFNLTGWARIVVNRAGNLIPLILPSDQWWDPDVVDSFNDEDSGDSWAIVPFGIGGGLSASNLVGNTVTGAAANGLAPYAVTGLNLVLSPKTKRKLRRGDQVIVDLQYSNGAAGNGVVQESVVGTIFIEG